MLAVRLAARYDDNIALALDVAEKMIIGTVFVVTALMLCSPASPLAGIVVAISAITLSIFVHAIFLVVMESRGLLWQLSSLLPSPVDRAVEAAFRRIQ